MSLQISSAIKTALKGLNAGGQYQRTKILIKAWNLKGQNTWIWGQHRWDGTFITPRFNQVLNYAAPQKLDPFGDEYALRWRRLVGCGLALGHCWAATAWRTARQSNPGCFCRLSFSVIRLRHDNAVDWSWVGVTHCTGRTLHQIKCTNLILRLAETKML